MFSELSIMDYSTVIKSGAVSYADVRNTKTDTQVIRMENGSIAINSMMSSNVTGVRVFKDNSMGFCYTNDDGKLRRIFKKALDIASVHKKYDPAKAAIHPYVKVKSKLNSKAVVNPIEVSNEEKILFLKDFEKILSKHKKVKNTNIVMAISSESNRFVNSHGSDVTQDFVHSRFQATVSMKDGDNIQQFFVSIGKHKGWEFYKSMDIEQMCRELLSKCETLLNAKHAPAGRFPVIVDPDLAGVFFHEAVGHACEADAVLEKSSVFQDKMGEVVGSPIVTLYDDATIQNSIGSFNYDSEGVRGRRTTLIENGVLKNYIHSRQTAAEMYAEPTGNGRAASASELPIPRMSNIVLKPGEMKPEELFESIKKGIYVAGSKGGVVEPTKGHFLFSAKEAFMIENGEITRPLRDVSLNGSITNVLSKISGVANDSQTTFSGGYCGKKGQHVPVGETCPHIKIDEVMIGGRNN